MSTLAIKRKISYNNQQAAFHNGHNCPVRSIRWYSRSMRWLQCGNKDRPLCPVPWMLAILSVLALWGRKHPWDKTIQYSKTQQLIARTSLPGLIADFPLALLHLVGGYLWMTLFILLAEHRGPEWAVQMIHFPERRKPRCLGRGRLRWENAAFVESPLKRRSRAQLLTLASSA